jgi:hypothetical protein
MSDKKKKEELSEDEKLSRRVDALMNPKLPDPPVVKSGNVPPLDIFKGAPADVTKATRTAPEVSGKLLDKVDNSEEIPVSQPHTSTPKIIKSKLQPKDDPPKDPIDPKDPLGDTETDKAVSDIAAKEGDTLLALQDAIGRKASHVAGNLAEGDRRKALHRHWAWLIFFIVFIVLVLLALPLNPYTCRWPVGVRLRVTTDIFPSVCK